MKQALTHQSIMAPTASGARREYPATLAPSRHRRGFTLTELMVAVAVLIVVIIGTSKIFGTASKVTGLGQAGASVMTEAAAIERQIRLDFERLCHEGFFAIRCVAVRNDFNAGATLLNPNLPPDAFIRADQLVFFVNGAQSMQTYRGNAGTMRFGQSAISMVSYSPAFQLRPGRPVEAVNADDVWAIDPLVNTVNPITPWYQGAAWGVQRVRFNQANATTPADYTVSAATPNTIIANQPPATQWLLSRSAILLADDGDSNVVFMTQHRSAVSLLDNVIRNGRVDAVSNQMQQVRDSIRRVGASSTMRAWNNPGALPAIGDQRRRIMQHVFYPRAEREAPSGHRVDQALTNSVISSACSSFIVEWTYTAGAGEVLDANGNPLDPDGVPNNGDEFTGMFVDSLREQPWFGLNDTLFSAFSTYQARGVGNLSDSAYQDLGGAPGSGAYYRPPFTILPGPGGINAFPNNIESSSINTAFIKDYWAVFGFNQDLPLDPTTGQPWPAVPTQLNSYTPFPNALRITMTLHDPDGRMESGREFQFVIDLTKRSK